MKEIYNCLFVLSIFIFVFALSIAGDAACRGCNFCWKSQFLFCFLFVFVFVHLHWVFIFVYLHWVFIFVYLRIYICLFTLSIAGDSAAGCSLFVFAFLHLHWVFIFVYLHQVVLKIVQLVVVVGETRWVGQSEWGGVRPNQSHLFLFWFLCICICLCLFLCFCVFVFDC